jgi:predicted AAA+ superfamily ATPase
LALLEEFKQYPIKKFNGENPDDRRELENKGLSNLIHLIDDYKIIFIDEGQKIDTIDQTLKILVDHYKESKQIIVTGSSSLHLLDRTAESLTGRKFVFQLHPLSLEEIYPDKDMLNIKREVEQHLIYGMYPEVVNNITFDRKADFLKEIVSSYLYKDILEFQQIKNSSFISNLLIQLALQVGSEVSYNELSKNLGLSRTTVENYIDILEKNFIIFRLPPYGKNKRREITKLKKIYFYDIGVRNALINNFNPLTDRNDVGALWENFIIAERIKYQSYHKIYSNNYFWRSYDGAEVDFVEERDGKLYGFEIKWKDQNSHRIPLGWREYKNSNYTPISRDNLRGFIV